MSQNGSYRVGLRATKRQMPRKAIKWSIGIVFATVSLTLAAGVGFGYMVFTSWFESVLSFVLGLSLESAGIGLTIWKGFASFSLGTVAARFAWPLLDLLAKPLSDKLDSRALRKNINRMKISNTNSVAQRAIEAFQSANFEDLVINSEIGIGSDTPSVDFVLSDSSAVGELDKAIAGSADLFRSLKIPVRVFLGEEPVSEFPSMGALLETLNPSAELVKRGLRGPLSVQGRFNASISGDENVLQRYGARKLAVALASDAQRQGISSLGVPVNYGWTTHDNLIDLIRQLDPAIAAKVLRKERLASRIGLQKPRSAVASEVKAALYAVRRVVSPKEFRAAKPSDLSDIANQAVQELRSRGQHLAQ